MKFLYKLFKLDPESREDIITATSGLGIAANILIASAKVIIGLLVSSIAIISEGVNNAADVLTSLLTLIGSKLAGRHPDEKHPFGYGRIEYLSGLVIAILILVSGVEMLKSAVQLIFEPAEVSINVLSLVIVAGSALIKFVLGVYTIKMGKKAGSGALEGVGLDCRNDSYASAVTILSALVFLCFHVSIDAFAGAFTSALIIKAGLSVLKDTVSELIGRPGEHELAVKIYNEVLQTEGVLNAADMMLHNYGPEKYSGSVNVEMDHKKTVGEIYRILHQLQLHIMHDYGVTMVFGIYAVDNDEPSSRTLRETIARFVQQTEHVKSLHAVYREPGTDRIYCDLIVDYKLRDWDSLRTSFLDYMAGFYPGQEIELTVETEFV